MNRFQNAKSRAQSMAMVGLFLAAAGCGGGKTPAGGSPPGLDNAPDWVRRGSRVQSGSIFGVGAVDGIKNTPLARDTAANRGRAEISRIMETYSASLMKDYQESVTAGDFSASSESQMVTQAIKTFSANLMNGTETKEFYAAPTGTWYALVELNFERAREAAAAQAKMSPGLKDWLDQNGPKVLADLEDDTSGARPPAASGGDDAPPASGGATEPPPPPPPANDGPAAKVGGPAPGWTQGNCDRKRFLCGVGDGPNRTTADNESRAELARIFQANIKSVAKSFEGAAQTVSSKTGENWVEVQKVSRYSMVTSNKVVTMSEILERWEDGKGRHWSLAVIDRVRASAALRDRIQQLDGVVSTKVGAARGTDDKVKRLKNLKGALIALAEREALNSDLRVISGSGIPAPHSLADLLALLDSASEELRLGIAVSGGGAERVRACLEEALTEKGYQIEANVDEDASGEIDIRGTFDVVIKGRVRNERRGRIAGGEVVQTTLTLKLINAKTGKILRTLTGSQKGTRPSVQAAASTSAFKICQKKVPSMVRDIDRYFR